MLSQDHLPKITDIGLKNRIRFYLYLWSKNRTQSEVTNALGIKKPAIINTSKKLEKDGLLKRLNPKDYPEEYPMDMYPETILSVPVEDIVRRICNFHEIKNKDEIITLAVKDRENFKGINLKQIKGYPTKKGSKDVQAKVAYLLYSGSLSFFFREIMSYGKLAKENKSFTNFLNDVTNLSISRDIFQEAVKKTILKKDQRNFKFPKFEFRTSRLNRILNRTIKAINTMETTGKPQFEAEFDLDIEGFIFLSMMFPIKMVQDRLPKFVDLLREVEKQKDRGTFNERMEYLRQFFQPVFFYFLSEDANKIDRTKPLYLAQISKKNELNLLFELKSNKDIFDLL